MHELAFLSSQWCCVWRWILKAQFGFDVFDKQPFIFHFPAQTTNRAASRAATLSDWAPCLSRGDGPGARLDAAWCWDISWLLGRSVPTLAAGTTHLEFEKPRSKRADLTVSHGVYFQPSPTPFPVSGVVIAIEKTACGECTKLFIHF